MLFRSNKGDSALLLAFKLRLRGISVLLYYILDLLGKQIDFTLRTTSGNNMLSIAINKNYQRDIITFILAQANYNRVSSALVNNQNNLGQTALFSAVVTQNLNIIESLITFGESGETGNKDFVNIQDNDGNTALMVAVEKGYKEVVEKLLKYGKNINFGLKNNKGDTVMVLGIKGHNYDIISMLVDSGAIDITEYDDYDDLGKD